MMWKFVGFVTFVVILQLSIVVEGEGVSVSVNCTDVFNIEIVISNVNDTEAWNESDWRLNNIGDSSCQPIFNDTANTATYNFNGSICDPSLADTSEHLIFVFLIDAAASGNLPVVAYDHQYNITCRYDRDGTVRSSFTPLHDLSASVIETLPFNGSLTLAQDTFGGTPVQVNIPLGTTIFAQLKIRNPFLKGLDLTLKECFFAKDGMNDGKFVIINDSCKTPHSPDPVSLQYTCSDYNNETENFKFAVVRYPTQDTGDEVYLQCDFFVCFEDNNASICREKCRECEGTRKRRDINRESAYEPGPTKYHLNAGPYRFVEAQEEDDADNGEQEADKPAVSGHVIIILVVCAVVMTAIVCGTILAVLRLRGRRFVINETVDSTMAIANPACEACDINKTI